MKKQDFLRECMSGFGIIPHNDFKQIYCLRCLNQKCAWSVGATTSFVHRAQNWKENLFTKVDRANENDPNYAEIRAKKFLPMISRLGSINTGFTSPNLESQPIANKEESEEITNEAKNRTLSTESKSTTQKPLESEDTKEDQAIPGLNESEFNNEASIPKIEEESEKLNFGMLQNTSFQQGLILDGEKGEKIIPAGGTVILDDE